MSTAIAPAPADARTILETAGVDVDTCAQGVRDVMDDLTVEEALLLAEIGDGLRISKDYEFLDVNGNSGF